MKKTFPVNINGTVFYIDEDAYTLLQTYLDQLRAAFPGEQGRETVDDIEARISEIFAEKTAAGTSVITRDEVTAVIDRMGRPDQFGDAAPEPAHESTPPPFPPQPDVPVTKKLYRDERNKVFGGVLAGLACYLGWNVTLMRVLLVILACCTAVYPLVIAYLVAWMIIPAARTPLQYLQMTGRPVTYTNIGDTILGQPDPSTPPQPISFWRVVVNAFMGIIGIIGGFMSLGLGIAVIYLVIALIVIIGWNAMPPGFAFEGFNTFSTVLQSTFLALSAVIALLIPSLCAMWAGLNALFNVPAPRRTTIITMGVIEVIAIIAAIALSMSLSINIFHHSLCAIPAVAAILPAAA